MDESERKELITDLVDALQRAGMSDGSRLLDLMRAEQNLVDALGVVRREIDIIVRSTRLPGSSG